MKIFLISDTTNPSNDLKRKLADEIEIHGNEIAYISSTPQTHPYFWFNKSQEDYRRISSKINLTYFDLSDKFTDEKLMEINNFKAIHLSGGNTFEFLDYIRKRNFHLILKGFLDDKLIIGVSAGAIIMTPSIEIALDEDENNVALKDFTGLSYVDFDFYPHFTGDRKKSHEISETRTNTNRPIFFANDEEGIFVNDSGTKPFEGFFITP